MSEASERRYGHSQDMQAGETRLTVGAMPRWVWLAVIVVAAVSTLGVGVAWNATTHAKRAEEALANESGHDKLVGQDVQALDERLTQAEKTNTQLQNELLAVTDKLKMTQGEVTTGTARRRHSRRLFQQAE